MSNTKMIWLLEWMLQAMTFMRGKDRLLEAEIELFLRELKREERRGSSVAEP